MLKARSIEEKDVAKFYQGIIHVSDEKLKPNFPKINTDKKDENGEIIYDDIVKNTTKLLNISCRASDEQKLLYGASKFYLAAGQKKVANEITKKIPKSVRGYS